MKALSSSIEPKRCVAALGFDLDRAVRIQRVGRGAGLVAADDGSGRAATPRSRSRRRLGRGLPAAKRAWSRPGAAPRRVPSAPRASARPAAAEAAASAAGPSARRSERSIREQVVGMAVPPAGRLRATEVDGSERPARSGRSGAPPRPAGSRARRCRLLDRRSLERSAAASRGRRTDGPAPGTSPRARDRLGQRSGRVTTGDGRIRRRRGGPRRASERRAKRAERPRGRPQARA